MKKNLLILVLCGLLFACAVLLCGCFGLFGNGNTTNDGKVALSEKNVVSYPSDGTHTYQYTGEEITVYNDVVINKPDNTDDVPNWMFDFAYENNVKVGTATVTITANDYNRYYYGSVSFNFTIEKGEVSVNNMEELLYELQNDNVYRLTARFNVDFDQKEVVIKQGVTLVVPILNNPTLFVVSGKLVNNGTIETAQVNSHYTGPFEFVNNGEIVNNGEMVANTQISFCNNGAFTNNGKFTVTDGEYTIFAKDNAIPNVYQTDGKSATQYVRTPLTAENVQLSFYSTVYKESHWENRPNVSLTYNGETYNSTFTKEYRDYDHAGTAYVDVTVGQWDYHFYGSVAVPYQITKATVRVKNVAEYNKYLATGNYGTFTSPDGFEIFSGEEMVIGEDVEFNTSSFFVYGSLQNNGTIVTTSAFILSKNGTLINNGSITTIRGSFSAPMVNGEKAQFVINGNAYFYHQLVNKGTFTVTPSDYALIEVASDYGIENSGTFTFDGEIVCHTLDVFSNSGTFVNTDTVWSNIELPNDFTNVIVKRQLTLNDVTLETAAHTYDGAAKPAVVTFATALTQGQYKISYTYDGTYSSSTTAPVNAGKITVTIQIVNEKTVYLYNSKVNVPYEILRAEIGVATAQQLYDASDNDNYYRVYLTSDITFTKAKNAYGNTSYLRVAKGVELDTNGYRLTIGSTDSASVYNYGKIFNSFVAQYPANFTPTVSDCGIYLSSSSMYNYGAIVNNNLFYVDTNSTFSQGEGSSIENHGLMYLTSLLSDVAEVVNDGQIYERENLKYLKDNRTRVTLDRWEWEYIAEALYPQLMLFDKNGDPVEITEDRFSIVTKNDVPNRLCVLVVTALDEFDQLFYGSCTLSININKSVAKVSDMQSLITATQDSNYLGYEIVAGFALSSNVTLLSGTFLDLGLFGFTGYSANYVVDCTSGAEIRVSVADVNRLATYLPVADRITFVGDITEEISVSVTFKSATMGVINGLTPFKKSFNSLTIDLNGHYVGGQIRIDNEYSPTRGYFAFNVVDLSADKTGQLGSGTLSHGLVLASATRMDCTLTGVTIGGMELQKSTHLTATGCTFVTTATTGNARSAYYCAYHGVGTSNGNNVDAVFTNCTFKGAVGAYLEYGHNTFISCDIYANGAYSKQGDWGSAILLNRNNASLNIDMGNFRSVNGYCVELVNKVEGNKASVKITSRTNTGTDEGSDATGKWTCGQSKKVNNYALFTTVDSL